MEHHARTGALVPANQQFGRCIWQSKPRVYGTGSEGQRDRVSALPVCPGLEFPRHLGGCFTPSKPVLRVGPSGEMERLERLGPATLGCLPLARRGGTRKQERHLTVLAQSWHGSCERRPQESRGLAKSLLMILGPRAAPSPQRGPRKPHVSAHSIDPESDRTIWGQNTCHLKS